MANPANTYSSQNIQNELASDMEKPRLWGGGLYIQEFILALGEKKEESVISSQFLYIRGC